MSRSAEQPRPVGIIANPMSGRDCRRMLARAGDTMRAAEAMRNAGCAVLIVLGGDGTNRAVCKVWRDAPLVLLSTGTNKVFPAIVEATVGGSAAGLLASGRRSRMPARAVD